MATKYGGASFSALTKGESKVYAEGWDRLTTSDQRATLLALHQTLTDPRVYRDTVAHFVGGSPAIALAADLAARSSVNRAPDGTPAFDVAFGLLDGERLLHPTKQAQLEGQARSAYKLPPTSGAAGMDQEIAKQLGGAFIENADGYERAKQAVYAYYAHLSNHAGAVGETQYDTSRLRQAIDTVAGERSKWAAGWMPWSGQTVLRPWGMPDGEFAARISNGYDAAMIAAKLKGTPADDKSRLTACASATRSSPTPAAIAGSCSTSARRRCNREPLGSTGRGRAGDGPLPGAPAGDRRRPGSRHLRGLRCAATIRSVPRSARPARFAA
jgi:hypothetical protein